MPAPLTSRVGVSGPVILLAPQRRRALSQGIHRIHTGFRLRHCPQQMQWRDCCSQIERLAPPNCCRSIVLQGLRRMLVLPAAAAPERRCPCAPPSVSAGPRQAPRARRGCPHTPPAQSRPGPRPSPRTAHARTACRATAAHCAATSGAARIRTTGVRCTVCLTGSTQHYAQEGAKHLLTNTRKHTPAHSCQRKSGAHLRRI